MKQYTKIAIPIYSKDQYLMVVSLAQDAATMPKSWEEWHQEKEQKKQKIQEMGMEVEEVPIDVFELKKFCEENHLDNEEAIRSRFASEKAKNT